MKSKRQSSRRDTKGIKVTYICSPVKVKTTASNFRDLVQELTGQDSNVAEAFMEPDCGAEPVNVDIKGSSAQEQWRIGVNTAGGEVYMPEPEASWSLKPDSRTLLVEPFNEQLLLDFFEI